MRRPFARAVGLIGALAMACPLAAAPPPGNPFSNRLAKLPELPRRAALRSAILDGGEYCKRVTADRLNGPYRNLVMWTVACDRGGPFGVFIGPDGSVQVRPCADLPKLKLPRCR